MRYRLPYGRNHIDFSLPDNIEVQILEPRDLPGLGDLAQARSAVLKELQRNADALMPPKDGGSHRSVAIAVNDKTRPVPHEILIPPLLKTLEDAGWLREEIIFLIAVGAHRPMPPDEFSLVLPGNIARGCRIVSHDADDPEGFRNLGLTAAGTPCRVNRLFADASLRIVVGNIEPHQFMGWSGGVKSAAIGLAARETIAANHALLASDAAGPCRYDDNPARQDVEELGRLADVNFALNVVMNSRKEILAPLAGDPENVMRRGIALGENLFTAPFSRPADLVIVAAGGHPKDINLYQAQKALRHGARAAAPGAPVILVAACSEGVGSRLYENWMADKHSVEEVRRAFEGEPFRLGHHKGMLFASDQAGRRVFLVSELDSAVVSRLLLSPADDFESALKGALSCVSPAGEMPLAILVPYGNSTVPVQI